MPGRVKCGGTEGEVVAAHGCWKTKKLICGTEEEIVVAHGRLPSPARRRRTLKVETGEEVKETKGSIHRGVRGEGKTGERGELG